MTGNGPQVLPGPAILPAGWPGRDLPVMPGDFTKYVPQGLGLGAPLVIHPWDDLEKALSRPSFYGLDPPESDPVRAAPSNLAAGGVIYFDDHVEDDGVRALLRAMEVHDLERDFAAFKVDAGNTGTERFLTQLRIIAKPALAHFFGATEEAGLLAPQAITIEEAVLGFLRQERDRWDAHALSGTLGGDGDWAKESLAFGFLVENGYWGVYRVWSRPWLVTK